MLKVVIIDDEALVRVGLKSMVNWEELGFEIIGEAANGQQGLELIIKSKPEIVITDIKMPVMDGLEMMRLVLKGDYHPQFIILSSYDEFSLVKQAMKLGAEEYLIKLDLEPEILTNSLAAAREKILAERGKFNHEERFEKGLRENILMLREGFFKRIINRPVQDRNEAAEQAAYLGIELNEGVLACALLRINNLTILDKYDPDEIRSLESSVLNTINEIVSDIFNGYTFSWNLGEFVIIFSGESGLDFDLYRGKAGAMAERLIKMLKQYFNISVSIGISILHQGYAELAKAYFESYRAIQHCFYSGSESIFFFAEIPKEIGAQERINIPELKTTLPKAIELSDLEAIRTVFRSVVLTLEEPNLSRGQAYDLCFQIAYLIGEAVGFNETASKEIIGNNNSLHDSILQLNTLPEIITWLTGLEQSLYCFLTKNEEQKNHRLVAKAKKYIMEHYKGDISLNEVANTLSISPGYLSTIFKQYTGICFIDYVTETKIDQAKKLLRESDYKVYEISEMLGFNNAYYFSKVFKKVTGMTPSEFSGKKI